jgi:hypothetical protein
VGKKKRPGRLPELGARVGCGPTRLQALGLASSPRVMARLPLTRRHALAPRVRTSQRFGKDRPQMRRRVGLLQAFDHCARPHMRWRLPLPEQASHASGRMQPQGCHRTPGMAAGLTEHVWTFRELLTAKFAPIHNQL